MGLRVRAALVTKRYSKGTKITDEQMNKVLLQRHTDRPDWNYSILPCSQMGSYS